MATTSTNAAQATTTTPHALIVALQNAHSAFAAVSTAARSAGLLNTCGTAKKLGYAGRMQRSITRHINGVPARLAKRAAQQQRAVAGLAKKRASYLAACALANVQP